MVAVKVWLGGEGPCDLEVAHALLRRVEPDGWTRAGETRWKDLRKLRVGASIGGSVGHNDARNVHALVLQAWEAGCEAVAFLRDLDADPERASAIEAGLALAARDLPVRAIGGTPAPCVEGWILALLGARDTDARSRGRVTEELRGHGIREKDARAYVAVVEQATHPVLAAVPPGCVTLATWLERAGSVLALVIRGG